MVIFVDDPDRLLDRIELKLQSAGACAVRTIAVVEAGVVKKEHSVFASHARLVLPVKGGRLVALGNVVELVSLAAHYPFNFPRPAIDKNNGSQVAVTNQKISLGSLCVVTSASTLPFTSL